MSLRPGITRVRARPGSGIVVQQFVKPDQGYCACWLKRQEGGEQALCCRLGWLCQVSWTFEYLAVTAGPRLTKHAAVTKGRCVAACARCL